MRPDAPARGPVRTGAYRPRRKPPKKRSSIGPLLFVIVVVGLVVGGVLFARPVVLNALIDQAIERDTLMRQPIVRALVAPRVGDKADRPLDTEGDLRTFEVKRGETAAEIGRRLAEEGFVRDALPFIFVLYDTGRETALQSGTYRISPSMTPREIARTFEKAPGDQVVLKIIEGWRLTEVATTVNKAFPSITREAFVAAAVVGERKNAVLAGLDPKTSLEGFLFPDTYFMRPDATAVQIVDLLLTTFEQRVGATLRTAANERKVPIYDIVRLASIVEREARDRSESAKVAGVYQNRLDIEMKLDADPTIQYALGDWDELSLEDLKIDSPYNTYRVAGLPPTPICNPGQKAIEGAARPEKHDFLFFVAKGDATGQHLFAKTLEEHEANRVKVGNR
ncbi:MAG TPA: endolytic transglycosylase MltG [Candidatus Limnocylindria bacterium]|nr:endolytic transglycosylase MltG [Candidatus Limnocylindria bacterium]